MLREYDCVPGCSPNRLLFEEVDDDRVKLCAWSISRNIVDNI